MDSAVADNEAATQHLKSLLNVGLFGPSVTTTNGTNEENGNTGVGVAQDLVSSLNGSAEVDPSLSSNFPQSPSARQTEWERILLTGSDDGNSFAITSPFVEIVSSLEKVGRVSGSSKVKIKPVVNYDFEHRYYHGDMVAVHPQGNIVGYVLRDSKGQGVVRVISRRSSDRLLLKGFQGRVTDLNFSHSEQALLAAVDEFGNLLVYEINEVSSKMSSKVVMVVECDAALGPPSNYHRVFWCPYIPDGPEDVEVEDVLDDDARLDDARKLLVVTHNERAEMWHVDYVSRKHGPKPLKAHNVETGLLKVNAHSQPITAATFAPDGTALATASEDGEVKFFQVYLQDRKDPRCLHQWKPHDGRPVSTLIFLDDHQNPNPDFQFWKFAITGCDHNSEIKLWSCETWSCLQTVRFSPPPSSPDSPKPEIKIVADLSFKFLVLSDVKRKVIYVLKTQQDWESNNAAFVSISEFGLTQPALSFCVYSLSLRPVKRPLSALTSSHGTSGDQENSQDEGGQTDVAAVLKLYSIHTKTIQELQIQCDPESAAQTQSRVPSQPSSQEDVVSLHDGLTDISSLDTMSDSDGQLPSSVKIKTVGIAKTKSSQPDFSPDASYSPLATIALPATEAVSAPILMAPDAFTSPSSPKRPNKENLTSPNLSSIAPPPSHMHPQIANPALGESSNLSGSGSTLTGITSLASTADETLETLTPLTKPSPSATRDREGEADILGLRRVVTPTKRTVQITSRSDEEASVSSSRISSQLEKRSSSTSLEVSEILQGGKSVEKKLEEGQLEATLHAPGPAGDGGPDVEIEEEEEDETTLRQSTEEAAATTAAAAAIVASKPQEDAMFENSEDDDDEDDALAADGGDEDEGDDDDDDVVVAPREVSFKCSAPPHQPPPPQVEEKALPAAKAAQPSVTHWPKAPLIDVPKEAKIHQAPKAKSDQVVGEIHATTTGASSLYRAAAAPVPVPPGMSLDNPGFSETSDRDDEEEEEESYSISSTSSSPRTKQNQPRREKRTVKLDHGGGAVPNRLPAVGSETIAPAQLPNYAMSVKPLMSTINDTVQSILEALQRQQKDILNLQVQVNSARNESRTEARTAVQSCLEELETNLGQKLDNAVEQLREVHQERLYAAMTDLAASQAAAAAAAVNKSNNEDQTAAKAQQEALLSTVNHTLSSTVAGKMERAVKEEVKKSLVPAVKTSMEPVKNMVQTELSQKLTTTDHALRESVSKMVRSRQAVEAIGQAAGQALQAPIQASYQEAFKNHVIPVFEKACNNMFLQINGSFQKGTREYMQNMEKELTSLRKKHLDQRDPIVSQLQAMLEELTKSQQQLLQTNQEIIQATLNHNMEQLHLTIQASVRDCVQHSVKQEFNEALTHHHAQLAAMIQSTDHSGLLRASAPTPVVGGSTHDHLDPQSVVRSLLRKGEINAAFKTALSTADLSVVTYLCTKVNPREVFASSSGAPCPLTQPVILSLVQQLSADLAGSDHADLKLDFLKEAIIALDASHPVTSEHLNTILPTIIQNLQAYITNFPENKNSKIVLMMAKSLLN